jgi:hypothetical protein
MESELFCITFCAAFCFRVEFSFFSRWS